MKWVEKIEIIGIQVYKTKTGTQATYLLVYLSPCLLHYSLNILTSS